METLLRGDDGDWDRYLGLDESMLAIHGFALDTRYRAIEMVDPEGCIYYVLQDRLCDEWARCLCCVPDHEDVGSLTNDWLVAIFGANFNPAGRGGRP